MFLTKELSPNKTRSTSAHSDVKLFEGATFGKAERLGSEKHIASLFEAGHRFLCGSFSVVYLQTTLPETVPVQLLISVPKRNFPHAVDRNRIKRLIREAYRMNKHPLYAFLRLNNIQLAVAFVYTSKKITSFNHIEGKIKVALSGLIKATGGKENI